MDNDKEDRQHERAMKRFEREHNRDKGSAKSAESDLKDFLTEGMKGSLEGLSKQFLPYVRNGFRGDGKVDPEGTAVIEKMTGFSLEGKGGYSRGTDEVITGYEPRDWDRD